MQNRDDNFINDQETKHYVNPFNKSNALSTLLQQKLINLIFLLKFNIYNTMTFKRCKELN